MKTILIKLYLARIVVSKVNFNVISLLNLCVVSVNELYETRIIYAPCRLKLQCETSVKEKHAFAQQSLKMKIVYTAWLLNRQIYLYELVEPFKTKISKIVWFSSIATIKCIIYACCLSVQWKREQFLYRRPIFEYTKGDNWKELNTRITLISEKTCKAKTSIKWIVFDVIGQFIKQNFFYCYLY